MIASIVPPAVARVYPGLTVAPTIVETFTPGAGWVPLALPTAFEQQLANANRRGKYVPISRRVSREYARSLARMGVTAVALRIGPGRVADFTTAELSAR